MLNVLRIVSLCFAIAAVGGAMLMVSLGLNRHSRADQFCQSHRFGQFDRFAAVSESKNGSIDPLVHQAHLFAERIDPPVTMQHTQRLPDKKDTKDKGGRKSKTDISIIVTDPPLLPKFDLLATVLCESAPKKSLALFQSGSKQQWFRSGETVDRYRIQEIKDGGVLMSEAGRTHEMTMQTKAQHVSLLKER